MSIPYYETSAILSEYLFFHYGKSSDYLPFSEGPHHALEFPRRIVERGLAGVYTGAEGDSMPLAARALDLGCAVGRSSFELSRFCQEVIGIDYSAAFVQAAQVIQKEKKITLPVVSEVGKTKEVTVEIPLGVFPERVQFYQGDAMNLSTDYGMFDILLAGNLIDRLPDPKIFLQGIGSFIKQGGILILTSPYTWMESFTPREKWLTLEGENFEALQKILTADYEFQKREEMPMLIREHHRKYQWTVSEMTVWRKK